MAECSTDFEYGFCCGAPPSKSQALAWMRLGFAALIAGQTMAFSLGANISPPEGTERTILHAVLALSALVVFLLIGLPLVKESWHQARAGRVVIEQMFLLGIAGAYAASIHSSLTGQGAIYYELVAILLAIYILSSLVMQHRRKAALQSAQSLRAQYDKCLRLDEAGEVQEISVDEVKLGERILVYPDHGIPVDGVLVQGPAYIHETALTGEPFPVVREKGDVLLAGSYVVDRKIVIESRINGRERKLDLLLESIDHARDLPSRIQREADRIITWFLPTVLTISILTFFGWWWQSGWVIGLFNALAVLVVACPCAMGLATPIGIMSALNAFARRGLVTASGDFIEGMSKVDTVVFDKTGTLSEESLQLVEFKVMNGFVREELRDWIGALEEGSEHPVARAFRGWTQGFGKMVQVTGVKILPGAGIGGTVRDAQGTLHEVAIGNAQIGVQEREMNSESRAPIYVQVDGQLAGIAILREKLRTDSLLVMKQLVDMGLQVEVMSGDQPERLRELGFSNARGGLLPEEKVSLVQAMQAEGRRVLFVGDGINDSAAMANATVSIALVSGAELTREVATAQLFGENLAAIPWARSQALRVIKGIRQNLWFAAGYNAVGILLAVSGILHPVAAALLMTVSSVWVTWRALRFGEKLQEEVVVSREVKKNFEFGVVNGWSWVLFGAMVLQGIMVAYLAQVSAWAGSWTVFVFALAGAWMGLLAGRWQRKSLFLLYAGMLAIGNFGMVLGWWVDIRLMNQMPDCCAVGGGSMTMGSVMNWMNAGMVLASLPLLFLIPVQPQRVLRPLLNKVWVHAVFCLGGMVLGMKISMMVIGMIMIKDVTNKFFLDYAAMTLGMFIGMMVCCKFYFTVVLGRVKQV